MSGNTLVHDSLKAFSEEGQVQPSVHEQLITVPSSLLESLVARIDALEDRVIKQDEKIAALETTQDIQADNQLIQLRLINDLRKANHKEPGKTEISRVEKIEKYLVSRPDHRATFETLKGYLQVNNARLNEAIKILIASSDHAYSIQKDKTGDKRKRVLIMLPR